MVGEGGVPVLTYIVKHSSSFSLAWLPVVCVKFKSIQSFIFFWGGGGGVSVLAFMVKIITIMR